MRICFSLAVAALVAVAAPPNKAHADEDLSIVVNPRTGAASIRNDTSTAIDLDGYLLRGSSGTFNPGAWNSLDEQGIPGWADGPAATNRLGDTNLFGSSVLAPGASLSIGSPYVPFVPTAIGQPEPTFNFTYSVPGSGSFAGDVEFSVQNTVVLVIDTVTGASTLQNQSIFGVDIDGYLIRSPAGVLNPSGWTPLQASNPAWRASTGAANRLAEGNLFGSTFLSPNGGSMLIGSAVNTLALADETDLTLEYHVPGVGTLAGSVLFTSAPVAVLPGDYNVDGRVDSADYTVWRDGGAPDSGPGGYSLWAANYGAVASSSAAAIAVPEPASAVLVAIGLVASLRSRSAVAV